MSRPTAAIRLAACVALLASLVPSAAALAQVGAGDERIFVGYLYGPPRGLNWSLYTHLCHAFATPQADGGFRPPRGAVGKELTREAHEHGVKVLLSLGGWGWDEQFAAIAAKPETRDRFVDAILSAVEEHDYDGIDFDWEYPDTEDEVAGWTAMLRRFRAGLDARAAKVGRPMRLTMAVSANPETLRWYETSLVLETLDWLHVMTYDMAGDWTNYAGHHSPLFASSRQPGGRPLSTEASMRYLVEQRKIPPERLAVGIPLYGRGFVAEAPYAPKAKAARGQVPRGDYANLHRLQNEGWTRVLDEETKVPWLISPDRKIVIGYDDAESVARKTSWALEHGFRGVFFWQVTADRLSDGSNPLQQAARRAWEQGRR